MPLNVSNTEVSEHGLRRLVDQGRIKYLYAADCKVLSLRWLKSPAWQNLKTLDLSGNAITDRELGNIESLTHLETLYLARTPVTGKCLSTIVVMPGIKMLDIRNTFVNGGDLRRLPREKLESLTIRID